MVLESIHNKSNIETSPLKTTKIQNKQRIISESTGLVKFSITSQQINEKVSQFENLNDQFAQLEVKANNGPPTKVIRKTRSGLNLPSSTYSPQRSPYKAPGASVRQSSSIIQEQRIIESNEDLLLELASKQREVLEYKTQIDLMKKKLQDSENDLQQLEKRCNSSLSSHTLSTKPYNPPTPDNLQRFGNSLRSKTSIQQLRSTIETTATTHQQNFSNLMKKKLSISQLNNNSNSPLVSRKSTVNLNENFTRFQKDTNQFFEKGLSFVTNLKNEIRAKKQRQTYSQSDYDKDFNSSRINYDDTSDENESDNNSDYGCADTSDFQLVVK